MNEYGFPHSLAELETWRRQHRTTKEEARRRFLQFVILTSISTSPLNAKIAFKGGNALRFIHGNERSTLDLDFTADETLPDDSDELRSSMDAALRRAERMQQVKARCQTVRRMPPGVDKTRPTYSIKVCYQLPGDKYYQSFADRPNFSDVIEVEISLNDLVCETRPERLTPTSDPIRTCSLEDIIGEKLRALLQQIPRNRHRPQDVHDIAAMKRKPAAMLDYRKIGQFLLRKSEIRGITATKAAFNAEVMSKAETEYETQIRSSTINFIPFDEAWLEVLDVVDRLEIPDR